MEFLYKKYNSFLLGLLISGNLFGICDEETQKKITQATPYELFGIIDTAKISAFKNGLVTSGLDYEGWHSWDNLIECCHLSITDFTTRGAPQKYNQIIAQLNATTDFIKNSITALHKKFSWALSDKSTLLQKIQPLKKEPLSLEDKQYLNTLRNEVISHNKKMGIIIGTALKKINEEVPTPQEWQLNVPTKLEDIFPCYKEFFESYDTAKKSSPQKKLTPQELIYFINITKVFSSKCLKNVHFDDAAKASALVDVLEKLNYRLEEDIKKSTFNKQRTKMIAASKEIIESLMTLYPHMITNMYFKKLSLTKDKPSIILFAEAKSLMYVLENLVKEVNQIITRENKKGTNHEK